MNGSQVPKIGSFLVEGFRFLEETILYLVVFGGNIPYSQSTSFTSMGQTREASARWAVLRSRKRLEFVSAKGIEHIVHIDGVVGSSPTVTTTNPVGVQVQRLPDFFAYP